MTSWHSAEATAGKRLRPGAECTRRTAAPHVWCRGAKSTHLTQQSACMPLTAPAPTADGHRAQARSCAHVSADGACSMHRHRTGQCTSTCSWGYVKLSSRPGQCWSWGAQSGGRRAARPCGGDCMQLVLQMCSDCRWCTHGRGAHQEAYLRMAGCGCCVLAARGPRGVVITTCPLHAVRFSASGQPGSIANSQLIHNFNWIAAKSLYRKRHG